MWTWIVLGILIVVVLGFLVGNTIWDKRKQKKIVKSKLNAQFKARSYMSKIAIWVLAVVEETSLEVKKFVPSVGNRTMTEIKMIARNEIKKIKLSPMFKSLKGDPIVEESFKQKINKLLLCNPNMWTKKEVQTINFWKRQVKVNATTMKKQLESKKYEQKIRKEIKTLFN